MVRFLCNYSSTACLQVSDFGLSRVHPGQRTVATMTYGTVSCPTPNLLIGVHLCGVRFHQGGWRSPEERVQGDCLRK